MYIYPTQTKMYLRQAATALDRMRNAQDGDDLSGALVSFLEATKHSLIQLQTEFKGKVQGFEEWWQVQRTALEKDTLCKYFYNLRNRVVKAGENVIAMSFEIQGPSVIQGPIQINDQGLLRKRRKGDSYEWAPEKNVPGMKITGWKFSDYPEGYSEKESPIALCEKYIGQLDAVADDFIKNFGRDR